MIRLLKPLIVTTVVLSGLGLLYGYRYAIYDWWRLYNYNPSSAISNLASDTTMTSKAKVLFYINHPKLEGANQFNLDCPIGGEHTIVLGCYKPVERGIYLFNITDKTLYGVEQVTAAHETLHAAYSRLSKSEKTYVNNLLQNYYLHGLHNPTVKAEIAAYKISEPNDILNEMHSIFGTEIAQLPPALENYYRQYFVNRAEIAKFAEDYRNAFSIREHQVSEYDKQLSSLHQIIDTDESTLNSDLQLISSEQNGLNSLRSSGNTIGYNNEVPSYNNRVYIYNQLVNRVRAEINQFNLIVAKRNAIALEENQLAGELNSKATVISP
jgi:hypothetical protein